jgi:hypothetical protein
MFINFTVSILHPPADSSSFGLWTIKLLKKACLAFSAVVTDLFIMTLDAVKLTLDAAGQWMMSR